MKDLVEVQVSVALSVTDVVELGLLVDVKDLVLVLNRVSDSVMLNVRCICQGSSGYVPAQSESGEPFVHEHVGQDAALVMTEPRGLHRPRYSQFEHCIVDPSLGFALTSGQSQFK